MRLPDGVITIKESMPITDLSADTAALAVKNVILNQENVLKLEIDARERAVNFWRVASDEEVQEGPSSLSEILRNTKMEEYRGDKENLLEQLFQSCEILEDAGYVPSHIVSALGPLDLKDHMDISRRARLIFGIPLHFVADLDTSALFVCGSEERDAQVTEIRYSVKVNLP